MKRPFYGRFSVISGVREPSDRCPKVVGACPIGVGNRPTGVWKPSEERLESVRFASQKRKKGVKHAFD